VHSYGNSDRLSVCLSVRVSVKSQYRSKSGEIDIMLSLYDGLESVVFRDKISCRFCVTGLLFGAYNVPW